MKNNKYLKVKYKKILTVILLFSMIFTCSGCVNQHPKIKKSDINNNLENDALALEIIDKSEREAVEKARAKVLSANYKPRIIATSPSAAQIFDKLDIDLVGISDTKISKIPKRYEKVKKIGMPMNPDMEIISSLQPDWIFSPATLKASLEAKYKQVDTNYGFLNLRSVKGMYRSIQEIGEIFNKRKQAKELIREFTEFYNAYKKLNDGKQRPKVLILMGLPGSYIIATEKSYVGNLVEMAGGINVYSGSDKEFLQVNTEDIKSKEPDIILRAAHALPEQVKEMFAKDFKTNDIWKHFTAVKNNKVYDLPHDKFGMSATFEYKQALKELQDILYKN